MSKFTTKLPTEVETLIAALPKNSYVHGIALDKDTNEVLVLWENTIFESGLTVPVDFSLADVKAKKLPKGVYNARKGKPATLTPPEVKDAPAANVAPITPAPSPYLTADEVAEAVTLKKPVEFMGVTPTWQPFIPKRDVFTAGYFYRLAEKPLDVTDKGV